MKNWSNEPRYNYSNEVQFKSMEKFLNFENVFLKKMKNSLHISICLKNIGRIMVEIGN
jgi:hypothetical protein